MVPRYENKKRHFFIFRLMINYVYQQRILLFHEGSRTEKLNLKYVGLFEISEKISNVEFRLNHPLPFINRKIHDSFHTSLLKPYLKDLYDRKESCHPANLGAGQEAEYEVKHYFCQKDQNWKKIIPSEMETLQPSRMILAIS